MCIHTHINTHIYTHRHTHKQTHIHTQTNTHTHIHTHTHTHTYTHTASFNRSGSNNFTCWYFFQPCLRVEMIFRLRYRSRDLVHWVEWYFTKFSILNKRPSGTLSQVSVTEPPHAISWTICWTQQPAWQFNVDFTWGMGNLEGIFLKSCICLVYVCVCARSISKLNCFP